MQDRILIKTLPNEVKNGKTRLYSLVQCPDCHTQRKVRTDSYKISTTTLCKSCNNLRRPTKSEDEKFNHIKYYHTLKGKASYIYSGQVERAILRGYSRPEYTREELITYLMNSPTYISLFNSWAQSGFLKALAPSVDRIDDYKSYTFNNIQIVTWNFNNDKANTDTVNGKLLKICNPMAFRFYYYKIVKLNFHEDSMI